MTNKTNTLSFSNGDTMPALGLGTWKSEPGEVGRALHAALEIGYRHIDCAAIYGNEPEIGQALFRAIDSGEVARGDLWITSKLWNSEHAPEDVRPALEQTLSDLRLESLDLYLMHWPIALKKGAMIPESADDFLSLSERPLADTWAAMEECVDAGLCRHIGVSNFSVRRLEELRPDARIQPVMNQVEMHPYLQQPGLFDYCGAHGIHLTAYAPLGSGDRPGRLRDEDELVLLDDPVVAGVASRIGCTPAQVLIRWAIERGISVIPKSVNPKRLAENFAAGDLELSEEDMNSLAALDRDHRFIDGTFWVHEGGPYTLDDLWG